MAFGKQISKIEVVGSSTIIVSMLVVVYLVFWSLSGLSQLVIAKPAYFLAARLIVSAQRGQSNVSLVCLNSTPSICFFRAKKSKRCCPFVKLTVFSSVAGFELSGDPER